ncbi:Uncharacterised protein [Halioglobus japonicus]|nr:Uncharacterised protein [Halioglobus japonicus]
MSRPARFTRRGVLIAGSATLAGGSALLLLDHVFESNSPLANSYAARRIGERFADTLANPAELWRGTPPASKEQWAPRLRAMISDDLEANRLVQVDGWWLAETELRLCVYIYTQSV